MRRLAMSAAALLAAGLGLAAAAQQDKGATASRSGLDPAYVDRAIRPQDDLFRHVNGKWLTTAEIPPDRSLDGAFHKLRDKSESDARAIIEKAASQASGPDAKKVGDFYAAFMDEAAIEAAGLKPIEADLAKVAAITDKSGLIRTMAALERDGVGGLFGLGVDTDAKRSDRYIVYLGQAGIGLPDESYYRDPKTQGVRDAYLAHIGRMFGLAGDPNAAESAGRAMALETRLAKGHWDRVKSRDDTLTYNKVDLKALEGLTPGFDWHSWAGAARIPQVDEVVVRQPTYFTAMAEAVDQVPLESWKAWLSWNVIRAYAPFLTKALADEDFAFNGRALSGTPQIRPRWKRAVAAVEGALGEAVGKLYVAEHFPPAAKARMQVLVKNLVEAYRKDIEGLDWMGPETKKKAYEKLARFTPKIGYPDKWRDYSKLEVRRDDPVGNMRRASAFEMDRNLAKLGTPIDRSEWGMTPQTVNAYYNPGMNEIVFPAAILQPPFFDMEAEDAVNYGGIGAVIGHEIGHGFDDQGSKYDGEGNMNDWWTEADRKEFEARAKMLIEQYNALTPALLPDLRVNGALTIGENIGDLGGLTIAAKAYKLSLAGADAPVLDGLTGPQRLFVGWAQVWRTKAREAEAKRRLTTDPHSPPEFRCNAVVRNVPDFYEAFGVKEGDALYLKPEDRVRIW